MHLNHEPDKPSAPPEPPAFCFDLIDVAGNVPSFVHSMSNPVVALRDVADSMSPKRNRDSIGVVLVLRFPPQRELAAGL
jgi:hypothetical protein